MKNRILVIIVTYNGLKWIDSAVASVRESSVSADIIAVDNGSTDGTLEKLAALGVRTVRMDGNAGFGAANNVGMHVALDEGYEFVYLLNQDARVGKDCLQKLSEALEGDGRYGILSPMQYDGTEKSLDVQFRRRCWKYVSGTTGVCRVPFVMAAHWMISRTCLLSVGGFSPVFKLYGEDDNYIDRTRYHGFEVGVLTTAEAVHDRSQRPNPKSRRMYLKCTRALAVVSNPSVPVFCSFSAAILELLAMGVLHFSSVPLKFIPVLLGRREEIVRMRNESKEKGAFL